jgi:hypothetical protein
MAPRSALGRCWRDLAGVGLVVTVRDCGRTDDSMFADTEGAGSGRSYCFGRDAQSNKNGRVDQHTGLQEGLQSGRF